MFYTSRSYTRCYITVSSRSTRSEVTTLQAPEKVRITGQYLNRPDNPKVRLILDRLILEVDRSLPNLANANATLPSFHKSFIVSILLQLCLYTLWLVYKSSFYTKNRTTCRKYTVSSHSSYSQQRFFMNPQEVDKRHAYKKRC